MVKAWLRLGLGLFLLGGENRMITNSIDPNKKRREEKRLTQSDLPLLVGVSQPTISQFEIGGVIPSEGQIKKITEILGIGPGTLNKNSVNSIRIERGS